MRIYQKRGSARVGMILAGAAIWGLAGEAHAAADIYRIAPPGIVSSSISGFNSSGLIAGTARTESDPYGEAAIFSGIPGSSGVAYTLGKFGGYSSTASAINSAGLATGSCEIGTNGHSHAFLYTGTPGIDGVMHDLGTLGGASNYDHAITSFGTDINDAGQVVGQSYVASGKAYGFIYTGTPGVDGQMISLGSFGPGGISAAYGINNSGQIAGYASLPGDIYHVILYTGTPGVDGVMHDVGTLGGKTGFGYSINESGQITGTSALASEANHAFLYTGMPGVDGQMIDLGTLGGANSQGNSINDLGMVVGQSDMGGATLSHAFVYVGTPGDGGHMVDLNDWLMANNPTEGAKWNLRDATFIDNTGLIGGYGRYHDGDVYGTFAFLLDASALVPEPGALSFLVIGGVFALRRHRCVVMAG